ncbi:MAG: FKBP-type peptidyl-prolyl cis-trans isomerase [Candidatus Geothermarchaeales archaeon]
MKEKDLVYIDYTGKVKESGEIFDTTDTETAKEAGIFNPEEAYEPTLVAIGKSWVVEGLEEALVGRDPEEKFETEIPPSKGFGERDPRKIELYTRRKLLEADVKEDLQPGSIVSVRGLPAVVRTAGGGRALLDFNAPLAGKTLIYDVDVGQICKTKKQRIEALVKRRFKTLAERKGFYTLRKKGSEILINLDEEERLTQNVQLIKRGIANDIFDFVPTVSTVSFEEIFKRPEEKEEEAEAVAEDVASKEEGAESVEKTNRATG